MSAAEQSERTVHVVRAVWVYENYAPVRAFDDKAEADRFAVLCTAYSRATPCRATRAYLDAHPAGPHGFGENYDFDVVSIPYGPPPAGSR